ncbi:hypothetical protein PHMEG_00018598 [Phytophthora megakarya]|uniref:Uncharacterized protein n=1 Tax=Phytophthora megakarya TaxID=4795 RepID=A0A225VTE0_9STRA|nr:hypothetical protein PHMEG_00018598 [Phytophthora megakarya]
MSAFFGLTYLGSQTPFDPVKETPIHTFQPNDFQEAFMQTYRPGFSLYSESDEKAQAANAELGSAIITIAQLPVMLRYLYKCPKDFDNVHTSALTLKSQSTASAASYNAYLKDGLPTREFISNVDFRAKMVKHRRMQKNPQEKALLPVTDTLTVGWYSPTITIQRKPNKSCDETRFASAMVKAGVYYY